MSVISEERPAQGGSVLQLGAFRFNLETKELLNADGASVPLRSQSAEVLAYLSRNAGELVSKDALIENVWDGTFVTDDSLVQCVADIRKALGDTNRKFVQTVPKKGYKLNLVATAAGGATAKGGTRGWVWPVVGVVAAVVAAAALAWIFLFNPQPIHGDDKPRIAVLAFDDFSTGEDQGYLSDAIAEGIITELARFKLIEVVARNSSFKFRDTDTDIRQIGEDLGVHYVLEGSQQKSGDKLKVTVQLIGASEGTHIWAHTYDQDIGDLFTVQDEIIKTVANRVGVRIERPVPGSDPNKVTALHLHLQGLAIVRNNFNEEAFDEIIKLNEQAIEIDPDAPYGYIGLAHSYRAAATFGWLGLEREESLKRGFAASDKLLEIAPDHPETHYSRARLQNESGDMNGALASYTKAIELNPSASNYLVGSTTPLLYTGHKQEAISRIKRAMGIDPFHEDWYHWQLGWALWEVEDCEGALASFLRMKKIRKGAHRMLAGIYACLGDVENAQKAYKVFYEDSEELTISEQRAEWVDLWTAPGSLERFLDHLRIAGMKD